MKYEIKTKKLINRACLNPFQCSQFIKQYLLKDLNIFGMNLPHSLFIYFNQTGYNVKNCSKFLK